MFVMRFCDIYFLIGSAMFQGGPAHWGEPFQKIVDVKCS